MARRAKGQFDVQTKPFHGAPVIVIDDGGRGYDLAYGGIAPGA